MVTEGASAGRRGATRLATAVAAARLHDWGAAALKSARGEVNPCLKSLVMVICVALLIAATERLSGVAVTYVQMSVLFLLPMVVAVVYWGVAAGVVAAIAGRVMVAYSFYPPTLSLEAMLDDDVSDARVVVNVVTLAILLAGIIRHQVLGAARREAELRQLYTFSRKLVRANSTSEIFAAIQAHLAAILERKVVLLRPEPDTLTCIPADAEIPSSVRAAAADMLSTQADAPDRVSRDGADARWLVRPVSPKTAAFGAIAVEIGEDTDASCEKIGRQIANTLTDAVEALELLEIDQAIQDTRVRAEADRLREAMIGSVSHDLCTPLSTILCSATVLSAVPSVTSDERLSGLVNAIREQAERHSKDIENLLDASRINAKAVRPNYQWTDVNDVVNSAIERLQHRRGARVVETRLPSDLPLVRVDALLFERALIQVLDNAAKYSDTDAPISLAAELKNGHIMLAVSDYGGGLTAGERARMWQRFFRGDRQAQTTSGFGLGLWVAQAFLAANGGTIEADSAGPGRGTTITIKLPLANISPTETTDLDDDIHD